MIRNHAGEAEIYITGSILIPDDHVKTTWVTAESTPSRFIKPRLCEAGPTMCYECQLCAFGRKYVKEHNHLKIQKKGSANQ